jgi:hypothetical protein
VTAWSRMTPLSNKRAPRTRATTLNDREGMVMGIRGAVVIPFSSANQDS